MSPIGYEIVATGFFCCSKLYELFLLRGDSLRIHDVGMPLCQLLVDKVV